jgi:hypothetical protein
MSSIAHTSTAEQKGSRLFWGSENLASFLATNVEHCGTIKNRGLTIQNDDFMGLQLQAGLHPIFWKKPNQTKPSLRTQTVLIQHSYLNGTSLATDLRAGVHQHHSLALCFFVVALWLTQILLVQSRVGLKKGFS